MMGDLIEGGLRSIYATFGEGVTPGKIIWESSAPEIVSIYQTWDGDMPEAYLSAEAYGKATITASLEANPNIKGTYEVEVKEGTVMSKELYNKIAGGVKFTTLQNYIIYDEAYQPHIDTHFDIETIYEENKETKDPLDGFEYTDQYQITLTEDGGTPKMARYVSSNGGDLATEYINKDNEVDYRLIRNEDGYSIDWRNTLYPNQFAIPYVSSNEMFKTYDGGHTYHYTGSYYTSSYLIASLYNDSFSADDIYITVENDVPTTLTMVVDPYNSDVEDGNPETTEITEKYGQTVVSVISDIGTAEVPSPTPYEHESYHDTIKAAIDTMGALKNYKASYTVSYSGGDKATYSFIFTEDTIDQIVTTSSSSTHTGIHKVSDEEYFEYGVSPDGTITKGSTHQAYWETENIKRYPTFDFAAEIFADKTADGLYVARGETASFFNYMAYFPTASSYWSLETASIKLDDSNHIVSGSAHGTYFDENVSIEISFSEFGTASTGLDFSGLDVVLPNSWDSDPQASGLYNSMQEWAIDGKTIDDIVPYVYCSVGYSTSIGWLRSDPTFIYFSTEDFTKADGSFDEEAGVAFYNSFIAALEKAGYSKTEKTETENNNAFVYENADGIGISIAREMNWSGTVELDSYQIVIRVNDEARLTQTDAYY